MRRAAWIAPLLALGLCGCGSMSDEERFRLTTPGTDDLVFREITTGGPEPPAEPTRREIRVIRGWVDALRAGKVERATRFFGVPTIVLDGANPQRILPTRAAVRDFNRGLPCGARLVGAERGEGWYVNATFELTERPGPGSCEGGVGQLAVTAFLVEDGRIVRWLRAPDPPQPDDETS